MINTKIFLTGSSASGKTVLAQKLSKLLDIPYIQYDNTRWDYDTTGIKTITFKLQETKFYNNLPDNFIIDAFPGYTSRFQKYYDECEKAGDNIMIVCLFIIDDDKWFRFILEKGWFEVGNPAFYNDYFQFWIDIYERIVNTYRNLPNINIMFFSPVQEKEFTFDEFEAFVQTRVKRFKKLKEKNQNLLMHYIDSLEYDKYYQDIECVGYKGYSESSKVWAIIKDLVDWKGKTVIDCGCFHGYFCLKIREAGADKVYGLDRSTIVLETSKLIKKIVRVSDTEGIEYKRWTGGEPTPTADVALVLNMLHHTDQEKTLQNINAKTIIFEINQDQRELVDKYYTTIQELKSEKEKRIILLTERKNELQ